MLVAVTLVGCGGDGGDDPARTASVAPQEPELVAAGEPLYAEHCASCHGDDLRGTDQGPSHLSFVYEPGHHADGAFLRAVQVGVRAHHWEFGDMPPVPGLDGDQVTAIVAFIREQQRTQGFEPWP
jgi:mono/diheme cytochrome c family protein